MKLIAVRHGETHWNVERRETGQLNSPLTPTGLAQAHALARRLGQIQFDALYSSDLGRAVQTADIIAGACGKPVRIDVGVSERHMGIFQGLTAREILKQYPAEKRTYDESGGEYQLPGGESASQRLKRSVNALTALAVRHEDATIVVVTHGGVLMGFFDYVLGLNPGERRRFSHNGSFSTFDYAGGKWTLETWNDIGHLRNLETLADPTVQR